MKREMFCYWKRIVPEAVRLLAVFGTATQRKPLMSWQRISVIPKPWSYDYEGYYLDAPSKGATWYKKVATYWEEREISETEAEEFQEEVW